MAERRTDHSLSSGLGDARAGLAEADWIAPTSFSARPRSRRSQPWTLPCIRETCQTPEEPAGSFPDGNSPTWRSNDDPRTEVAFASFILPRNAADICTVRINAPRRIIVGTHRFASASILPASEGVTFPPLWPERPSIRASGLRRPGTKSDQVASCAMARGDLAQLRDFGSAALDGNGTSLVKTTARRGTAGIGKIAFYWQRNPRLVDPRGRHRCY